jgi:putative flippase GtrA
MGVCGAAALRVKAAARALPAVRLRRQLLLYAAIGSLAVTVDVVLFRVFAGARWTPELAAVASGLASMAVHFTLNKYVNFRSHARPLRAQLGTYCAVTSVWWIVTIGVVAILTRGAALPPVAAKLIAVAINFPLGFVLQRQFTFGAGIGAALRRRSSA